ncbi:MAG: IPT/TIG domain-containing protein [Terriglobia bacterium]
MRTLPSLLLCTFCLASSLAAQSWKVDPSKIREAAQDSTGQVWGINLAGGGSLSRWDASAWKPLTPAGVPEHSQLTGLARGSDGAVYGVWNDGADTLVTRHEGATSKVLARFTGRLRDRPHIFVDVGGNAWVTEQGKRIFRVTPAGEAECVYAIPDGQFREEGRPQNDHSPFNPIYATADARGRIWFWSDYLAGRTKWASLQGVLIFDGEKFEHHPQIAGIPDKRFSIVAPDDADHMWLAVADDQLYRIDIHTFTATPARAPDSQAFAYVQEIFRAGQDTYVVSGPVTQPVPEISGNGRSSVLWRLRNGAWTRVVNGIDMGWNSYRQAARPFVATEGNLWLGAFASGPWFIPQGEGNPVLVDWRYGNPLDGSEGLFLLPDGRLLISSPQQGSLAASPADLLATFEAPPEVRELNPTHLLIQDARGHLLGVLATAGNAFSDWDGHRWTEHTFPHPFKAGEIWQAMEDSLGRTWFLARSEGEKSYAPPVITSTDPNVFAVGQPVTVILTGTNFGTNTPGLKIAGVTLAGPPTILSHSDTKLEFRMTITAPGADGKVNFWITPNGYGENHTYLGPKGVSVAIFDPQRGSFETFPTYTEALQAQLPLRKDFHLKPNCCLVPSFTSDGRICYLDESPQVRYFDGQMWQQWAPSDITGLQNIEAVWPPFFDRAGNLAVTVDEKTWEYTKAGGWRATRFEPWPGSDEEKRAPAPMRSFGCGFSKPDSVARDHLGTYWLTYQRQLYRAITGLCVAQFSPQDRQPFIDSRTVRRAYIDPAGDAFLETWFNTTPLFGEYVIMSIRRPPSPPKLRAAADAEGSIHLHLVPPTEGKVKLTWRVNGGEWNIPTQKREATLPWLPNGQYRIEAATVDDRLQIGPTPAVAEVEIHVDPRKQVLDLIEKLNDPDYSVRDAAVAALVRQPALALPLLQSAREKADPHQRWWIDAAIQQIQEHLGRDKQP